MFHRIELFSEAGDALCELRLPTVSLFVGAFVIGCLSQGLLGFVQTDGALPDGGKLAAHFANEIFLGDDVQHARRRPRWIVVGAAHRVHIVSDGGEPELIAGPKAERRQIERHFHFKSGCA